MKVAVVLANEAPADALASLVLPRLLERPDLTGLAVSLADPAHRIPAFRALVEIRGRGAREAAAALAGSCTPGWLRAWVVDEAQPLPLPRSAPLGAPTPGLRLLTLCRRRAGLSRAEFARVWREEHARVALSFAVPPRGYTQDVVLECLAPPDDVDGIAGLHFASHAEFDARYREHPEDAARGLDDAARFMDLERGESAFAIETVHRDSAPPGGEPTHGRTRRATRRSPPC